MTRAVGVLALALVAGALACTRAPVSGGAPPPPPVPAPTLPAPATSELLTRMATLVGAPDDLARVQGWAEKIDHEQATLGAYIDELLTTKRFGAEVIPSLLFAAYVNVRNYYALPSAFVFKRASDGVLYLRAPCPAAEAIAVRPWWDLTTEVQVCPDSFRPDKWTLAPGEHSYRTALTLSCDSQVGSPELETRSLCGCGPNLIRCLRDEEQYNQLTQSFMAEVRETTAYVVDHDLPMSTLFTGNATFRDRNVEAYYRRQKIGALQLKHPRRDLTAMDDWPEQGQWAPRDELRPGQHAGVLTAPQILHWLPDRRQRQRGYYEILWCNLRNSFGATTHAVLELNAAGNNFFVAESWKRLAHTELCMNCHARLDYGAQFFSGYPDSRASVHYIPALENAGTGPLYGRDLRDHRGDAPLTPLGFARLATTQPDFQSCMASHFISHVLGDRATSDDVHAIEAAVAQTQSFRASMKVALERYALRWREASRPAEPSALAVGEPPKATHGGIPVSPALRAQLDRHCGDCHDTVPYNDQTDSDDVPFNFAGTELPRTLMVSMTDHVAFGMMPKNQPLDPLNREEVVGLLIDALWSESGARLEARRYYLGKARAAPAHQIDNAIFRIDQLARARSNLAWGALERGIWSDQATMTPGFLTVTGLEAARACARSVENHSGSLEDCVRRATALDVLSRWPPARAR